MSFIRDKYIPSIVKHVIQKSKPTSDAEFIEFAQSLYDQIKKKEKEIHNNQIN